MPSDDDRTPEWLRNLPEHIRFSPYQVERLELIRREMEIPHGAFQFYVQSHPECRKMLQRSLFEQIRESHPGIEDELAFVMIIVSRFRSARVAGGDLFNLSAIPGCDETEPPEEMMRAIVGLIRDRDLTTIDDVAEAIIEDESSLPSIPPAPGFEEAARQVSLILAED